MPDAQGFLGSIVKDLSSNFGPSVENQIRDLVQKAVSQNLGQLGAIFDKLIKDISSMYEIDFRATNPLRIGIVEDGIKIDADFTVSVKRKQSGQEIASMQIPLHPEKIKVEQMLVQISQTKLKIEHQ